MPLLSVEWKVHVHFSQAARIPQMAPREKKKPGTVFGPPDQSASQSIHESVEAVTRSVVVMLVLWCCCWVHSPITEKQKQI